MVKHILVKIEGQEPFEIEVLETYGSHATNDFRLNHPKYKRFQYDSAYERHTKYTVEYRETVWFIGYLIDFSKKNGQVNRIVDCEIQVRY